MKKHNIVENQGPGNMAEIEEVNESKGEVRKSRENPESEGELQTMSHNGEMLKRLELPLLPLEGFQSICASP